MRVIRQKIEIDRDDADNIVSVFMDDMEWVKVETTEVTSEDETMYYDITCKTCGKSYESRISGGYGFCPHCGRKVRNVICLDD